MSPQNEKWQHFKTSCLWFRSSNSLHITFSFSKKKNLRQKSLSVQLTVLNFHVEEFYLTSWYNSVHSFYPSSGNCHLFLRGEIVVYFLLQLGLSWRNQVQEHFSKSQRVRMSKIDNIITYLTKNCFKTWSLTMSRDAEGIIRVIDHEPKTKKCFTLFLWP